jgi:hypothetical protein
MKNASLPIISATCLLCLLIIPTQGTLVVSNIEQTPVGNAAIGSDFWIAQSFKVLTSDTNLYTLDSVQLRLDPANGVPGNFEVSLYSGPLGFAPQDYLGHLDGPSDPSTSGIYNYESSGIEISSGKCYYIVAAGSTPIAQGACVWSTSQGVVPTQSGSWVIQNLYYSSSDGSTWEADNRREAFQVAIHATVVPEPTTLCLAGIGLGFLWLVRRSF